MILHLEDWAKYPTATPDWHTRNQSFLNLVALYDRMGVKNSYFILALVNPDLKGVDPHNEYLTLEQKMAIYHECCINPWYFLREVCRVRNGGYVPYIANRGNIALMWLFLNHIDLFLIQPRQTGKSVGADCLMIWLMYFGCRETKIQLITKDSGLRSDNIARMKIIRDGMPAFLVPRNSKDSDNTENIIVTDRKMIYQGLVPRGSEADAAKVGRGATSEILQVDEGPYIRFIKQTLQSALGSTTAARAAAKRRGTPYGVIYTTTAGKIDDRDGAYVYSILKDGATWSELFYDAGNEELASQMVKDNGSGEAPLVNCTFSHRQLGITDEEMWDIMARNKARGEDAERDYLNRWTNGTGSNPISPNILKQITESEMDPLHQEICDGGYIVRWYLPKDRIMNVMNNGQFVIGLDTSDMIGRDAIFMTVIDVRDRSVVATGKYNRSSIWRWISFLANFMIKYPSTTLVPERKSSAQTIIDGLIEIFDANDVNPFARIFNHVVNEKDRYETLWTAIQAPSTRRKAFDIAKQHFGYVTTADSRNTLYIDILDSSLSEGATLVKDKGLSEEFRGLVVRNGRIDHKLGGHDDAVVSYLLANWLLTHGKNLSYYGIQSALVRSDVRQGGEKVSVEKMVENERQQRIKAELDELLEQYHGVDHEFEARRLEMRIRNVMSKLRDQVEIYETVNELLEKATNQRRDGIGRRSFSEFDTTATYGMYGFHSRAA